MKLVYGVLGLALTVVSVTGANVWLARRRKRDYLNALWTGIVWGAPVALAASAFAQVILGVSAIGVFWLSMASASVLCLRLRNERAGARALQGAFAIATLVLLAGYAVRFGQDALTPAALGVNAVLLGAAALSGRSALRSESVDRLSRGRPALLRPGSRSS